MGFVFGLFGFGVWGLFWDLVGEFGVLLAFDLGLLF